VQLISPHYYIRPNEQRARFAIIFARIYMAVLLLQAFVQLSIFMADKRGPGKQMMIIYLNGGMGLLVNLSSLGMMIALMIWMRRAYANLGRAGIKLRFHEGWAIGSWFVPIMSWIRPYRILKETWNHTDTAFRDGQYVRKPDSIVSSYWMAYIGALVFSFFAGLATQIRIPDMDFLFTEAYILVAILASSWSVTMIRRFSAMEIQMSDRAMAHFNKQVEAVATEYRHATTVQSGFPGFDFARENQDIPFLQADVKPIEPYLVDSFISNSARARFVKIMLCLLVPFVLVYAFLQLYLIDHTDIVISNESRLFYARMLRLIGQSGLIVLTVAIIATMSWMVRAYRNLHNINEQRLSFKPEMAFAGWIIPVANLYIPYTILVEILHHSTSALQEEEKPAKSGALIFLAWAFSILGAMFLVFNWLLGSRLNVNVMRSDVLKAASFGIIASVFLIAAIITAYLAVLKISNAESGLLDRVEARFGNSEADSNESRHP
jgi:hypothetical protein